MQLARYRRSPRDLLDFLGQGEHGEIMQMALPAAVGTPGAPLPADLVTSLRGGRVHLFVGSGPSCAAGLPSWDALIQEMTEAIRRENQAFPVPDLNAFLAHADHLDTAELFRQTVGANPYFRFLRQRYRRDVRPSALHRAIARLPAKTIFTSNYDKLLEAALRWANGSDPTVIIDADQLNYIDDDEVRVIKIHGDIDHPRSIVLTRSDYASYPPRHRELGQLLQSSINGWTVLFIGFGLRDPNFARIYSDARSFYDSTNRQSYAVMAGTNAVERSFWHDGGLTILPVGRQSQVAGVLNRLRVA